MTFIYRTTSTNTETIEERNGFKQNWCCYHFGRSLSSLQVLVDLVKRCWCITWFWLWDKYQKLPIVIQLKDFDADCTDLIAYIKERIHIQNLEEYVRSGKCVFLLDGMDEIKSWYLTQFEKELSDLADRYPENNFILSSRPISDFIALSKFDVYELAPFTKEQALQLIDQLVYRPESPELKASFRREAMKVSGKHIGIL